LRRGSADAFISRLAVRLRYGERTLQHETAQVVADEISPLPMRGRAPSCSSS
jgi:hypothetical protein